MPKQLSKCELTAEELAAEIRANEPTLANGSALQRASLPGLWHFTTPNRRVLALIRSGELLADQRPKGALSSHLMSLAYLAQTFAALGRLEVTLTNAEEVEQLEPQRAMSHVLPGDL